MRNREHQNLYDDRFKIKTIGKKLKNQNKKLDELASWSPELETSATQASGVRGETPTQLPP